MTALDVLKNPDSVVVRASHLERLLMSLEAVRFPLAVTSKVGNPNKKIILELTRLNDSAVCLRDVIKAIGNLPS